MRVQNTNNPSREPQTRSPPAFQTRGPSTIPSSRGPSTRPAPAVAPPPSVRPPVVPPKMQQQTKTPQRPLSPRPQRIEPYLKNTEFFCEGCGNGKWENYACGHRLCIKCIDTRKCPVCGAYLIDMQAAYEEAFENVINIYDLQERYEKFTQTLADLQVPDYLEKGEYWGGPLEEGRLPTDNEFEVLLKSYM
ncbi:MAG: hypothetical protein AAB966_03080 [Patescibacteria group bacterium]